MNVGAWIGPRGHVALFGVDVWLLDEGSSGQVYVPAALLPNDSVSRRFRRAGSFGTRAAADMWLQLKLVEKGWRRR